MRYGSLSVDTSYQPRDDPASAAARAASVMTPSTNVTSAPYSRHSRMKGVFTSRGRNTFATRPALAAYAAIALPALPADGTDTVVTPSARARVIAADCPRALNEFVGFSDSSFTYRRSNPSRAPSVDACKSGVRPSPSVTGASSAKIGINSRYRHMFGARCLRLFCAQ